MTVEYNVIDIINRYSIVINYGFNSGAEEGEKIRIFTKGKEMFDLNKKSLGHIEMIKEELEIVKVFDFFSICEKIEIKERNVLQPMLLIRTEKTKVALNVEEKDFSKVKYRDSTPIKVGDFVKILK